MKFLRYLLTSHVLLAIVAIQVFQQVWNQAVGEPLSGFLITLYLAWKLGCLASVADWYARWDEHAKEIKADMDDLVAWFESLPAEDRVALASQFAESMDFVTRQHQRVVATRDVGKDPMTLREAFPRFTRIFPRWALK